MIEAGLIAGYMIAWAVRKARRAGGQLDAEVDAAIDAGLNKLHEVVAAKLGPHPVLEDLADEAAVGEEQVSELTRQQVELVVTAAARKDDTFGRSVTELLAQLRAAEQASGRSVVAGAEAPAFTWTAHVHASRGGIAFGQVAGEVHTSTVLGHTVLVGDDLDFGHVDDQVQTRLASTHEAMHAALNATTPFGAVLTTYHLLAQENDEYRPALRKLIAMCDAVHEGFATFLSVRIMGLDLSAVPDAIGYRDAYRRADSLVPSDLPGKTMMVEAGLRACMSPMVLSRLAEHDFSPDTPDLIRDEDQPNNRLLMLETAGDVFWEHAWSRTINTVRGYPGWPEWQLSTADGDAPRGEAAEAVEDRIAALVFAEVATWFDRQGTPVQPQTDLIDFGNWIRAALQRRLYRIFEPPQYAAPQSASGTKPDAAVIARQLHELRLLVAREGQADVTQALSEVLGTLRIVAVTAATAARDTP